MVFFIGSQKDYWDLQKKRFTIASYHTPWGITTDLVYITFSICKRTYHQAQKGTDSACALSIPYLSIIISYLQEVLSEIRPQLFGNVGQHRYALLRFLRFSPDESFQTRHGCRWLVR